MNFTTPIAPVFAAALLLSPFAEEPSKAAAQVNVGTQWEFITDADDGTLYFGGPVTRVGNNAVLLIKSVNDPELPPGEEDQFRMAFNCANRTYKKSNGWVTVGEKGTVGYRWFKHACGASPLKVSRTVQA
ncbi:hypothetical protein [Synechococcus sp. CC9605]|uniref:hypothetical protein n=1 Tax=Synechococcus sp. (strain CC9605) TaxID=110662 RepID=UPI00005D5BB5|nr:hypothetical protein [Synechococcus sp. CC9605]ABB35424.1 hypothetical protein Syncc9605_1675 [Synechococcus sp. CC9605]